MIRNFCLVLVGVALLLLGCDPETVELGDIIDHRLDSYPDLPHVAVSAPAAPMPAPPHSGSCSSDGDCGAGTCSLFLHECLNACDLAADCPTASGCQVCDVGGMQCVVAARCLPPLPPTTTSYQIVMSAPSTATGFAQGSDGGYSFSPTWDGSLPLDIAGATLDYLVVLNNPAASNAVTSLSVKVPKLDLNHIDAACLAAQSYVPNATYKPGSGLSQGACVNRTVQLHVFADSADGAEVYYGNPVYSGLLVDVDLATGPGEPLFQIPAGTRSLLLRVIGAGTISALSAPSVKITIAQTA